MARNRLLAILLALAAVITSTITFAWATEDPTIFAPVLIAVAVVIALNATLPYFRTAPPHAAGPFCGPASR